MQRDKMSWRQFGIVGLGLGNIMKMLNDKNNILDSIPSNNMKIMNEAMKKGKSWIQ